jgi:hypothetical protein
MYEEDRKRERIEGENPKDTEDAGLAGYTGLLLNFQN